MKRTLLIIMVSMFVVSSVMTGCGGVSDSSSDSRSEGGADFSIGYADTSDLDFTFEDDDLNGDYSESPDRVIDFDVFGDASSEGDDTAAHTHIPGTEATCTEAQKCTVCGVVIVAAKGHTLGSAATCTAAQECVVCGITVSPINGHHPGAAATCTADQICTVCGEVLMAAKGHIAGPEATLTDPQVCTVCGEVLKAAAVPEGIEYTDDSIVITAGGTYTLSNTLTDVILIVDVGVSEVQLVFRNLTINNSKGPAMYVRSASKVTVTLDAESTNTLTDGKSYTYTDGTVNVDAAIFSRSDITFNGSGSLSVRGNNKHAICSKDELVLVAGTFDINASNVGIEGKDYVKINGGDIAVVSGTDGIRATNAEDPSKGYVYIYGGALDITSGNDGIQAESVVNIEDVSIAIKTGGGCAKVIDSGDTNSYKGIKAASDIIISGGTYVIDSREDAVHSDGTVGITGGIYTISAGDEGICAKNDIAVSGSSTRITVNKSTDSIKAVDIEITDGTLKAIASNDGIRADGSLTVAGGTIDIRADGDCFDSKGPLSVKGGNIYLSGAATADSSILDFDATASISGGSFVGTCISGGGTVQRFNSATQGVLLIPTGGQSAGSVITVKDSSGSTILTYTASDAYSVVLISHSSLVLGGAYTVTAGSYSTTVTISSFV